MNLTYQHIPFLVLHKLEGDELAKLEGSLEVLEAFKISDSTYMILSNKSEEEIFQVLAKDLEDKSKVTMISLPQCGIHGAFNTQQHLIGEEKKTVFGK